jgi:hypothetical protein
VKAEMDRAYSTRGEKRNAYRNLVVKQQGKRPLETHTHRLVDIIKIYPREEGWGCNHWIDLAEDWDL